MKWRFPDPTFWLSVVRHCLAHLPARGEVDTMDRRPPIQASELALIQSSLWKAQKSRRTASEFDEAFKLIQVSRAKVAFQRMDAVNINIVGQKIDWRLLPILCVWMAIWHLDRFVYQVSHSRVSSSSLIPSSTQLPKI